MIGRLKKWFWTQSTPELSEPGERLSILEKHLPFKIPEGHYNLFRQAMRHRSIIEGEKHEAYETYERLEFLGDAVLDLIVTEILFDKYPHENEGFLTKLRAKIVRGDSLSTLAKKLELNKVLEVGERASGQGIELSKSVLADVYEALIAAIYVSQGYKIAFNFVYSTVDQFLDFEKIEKKIDNYKSLLMEYSQSEKLSLPSYQILSETGPGHNKTFQVAVFIDGKRMGEGTGKSKKRAEQEAAKEGLKQIKKIKKN